MYAYKSTVYSGRGADIVMRLSQSLHAAEVFLSSLHRDVAQEKLNIFPLTEPSTRPSKVMRREFQNSMGEAIS